MNKRYFNRADLKSGMLVEYSGQLCLVIESTYGLCVSGKTCWCPVEEMDTSLLTKVYDLTFPRDVRKLEVGERTLIWESAPSTVEVSLYEIAKKFGVSVEQLRIKD